jgi:hypothetical protein
LPAFPILYLSKYPTLERIGADDEDPEDFVTIIERRMLIDYQELFDKLNDQISNFKLGEVTEECLMPSEKITDVTTGKEAVEIDLFGLKSNILSNIVKYFPEPYAEHIDFSDDFL